MRYPGMYLEAYGTTVEVRFVFSNPTIIRNDPSKQFIIIPK